MIVPGLLTAAAERCGLGTATIHVVDLAPGGLRLAHDDGRSISPASMIKTPLAVAAATAIDAGRLRFEERVAVLEANLTPTDAPSPLVAGASATLGELIDLMLERSDNVATNMLFDLLDRDWATAEIAALGLPQTAFRHKLSGSLPLIADPSATGRNSHPAREAATLFERIARGTVPHAQRLRRALSAQIWNDKLSAGLEPGDRFAHKTGDTDEVSHDGGILELAGGGRYVLVVYSELPSNSHTDARFAAFMRALRPLLTGGIREYR